VLKAYYKMLEFDSGVSVVIWERVRVYQEIAALDSMIDQ
jgi:hypothetical protein